MCQGEILCEGGVDSESLTYMIVLHGNGDIFLEGGVYPWRVAYLNGGIFWEGEGRFWECRT